MKRAVFLERDGILNEVREGPKLPITPLTFEEFNIKIQARASLLKLRVARFVLIATTNQPGLSRGYQSRKDLDRMHEELRRTLPLDDILVCPHDENDHCPCRTPRPGLIIEAAFKHHVNLDHSFVISNRWQDAEAARITSCTAVLIQSPWIKSPQIGVVQLGVIVADLESAVQKTLELWDRDRG